LAQRPLANIRGGFFLQSSSVNGIICIDKIFMGALIENSIPLNVRLYKIT